MFFIPILYLLSFLFRRKSWRATLVYLFIPVHVNILCDTNSVSYVCYAFFLGNNFLEECSSFCRILFLLEIAIIIIFLRRPGFPGCLWILFYFIILYYFILFSKNTWGLISYVFLFACVRFTMNRIISQYKQSYWRELIPDLRHNRIIYNLLVSPKGFLSHYYKLTS